MIEVLTGIIGPKRDKVTRNSRHILNAGAFNILTSFIACIFIELNCTLMTLNSAPLLYKNEILHRFYMFRRHAIFRGLLHQDLGLALL